MTKALILSLSLISSMAFAAQVSTRCTPDPKYPSLYPPSYDCTTEVQACPPATVCPPAPACPPCPAPVVKKVAPKKKAPKKVVVKKQAPVTEVTIVVSEPVVTEEEPAVIFGVRSAIGYGFQVGPNPPSISNTTGFRVRVPAIHLGLEAYTAWAYGSGIQALFYPYQGQRVAVQLNLGVLGFAEFPLSTGDVSRTWDMTYGAGVEVKVIPHLYLTGDWRVSMPNPVFIAENSSPKRGPDGKQIYGPAGRYLNVGNVIGNSLGQSQFLIGLMLRN